jgi:hypothetical protein
MVLVDGGTPADPARLQEWPLPGTAKAATFLPIEAYPGIGLALPVELLLHGETLVHIAKPSDALAAAEGYRHPDVDLSPVAPPPPAP